MAIDEALSREPSISL